MSDLPQTSCAGALVVWLMLHAIATSEFSPLIFEFMRRAMAYLNAVDEHYQMLQLLIFPLKQRIISYNCRLIKNEQNDKENF